MVWFKRWSLFQRAGQSIGNTRLTGPRIMIDMIGLLQPKAGLTTDLTGHSWTQN